MHPRLFQNIQRTHSPAWNETWEIRRTGISTLLGSIKRNPKYINFFLDVKWAASLMCCWSLPFWGPHNSCHLSWWVQCDLQCWNCSTTSLLSDSFLSGIQNYSSGRAMGLTDEDKTILLKHWSWWLTRKQTKRRLDSYRIPRYKLVMIRLLFLVVTQESKTIQI